MMCFGLGGALPGCGVEMILADCRYARNPPYPLFGFALALVAYNIFYVMISALDGAHEKPVSKEISGYYIAHEIAATFLPLVQLGEELDWKFVAASAPPGFATWLRETARDANPRTLKRDARGPRQPKAKALS